MKQLHGIHHVTAVTANAPANLRFYTRVLGMRLVKRTVNQDDVAAYHLFYADGLGSPGTDLTFFDWPSVPEKRGTRSVARTGLRVNGEGALAWWAARFVEFGVANGGVVERDGRMSVDFEDPEGQRFSLVDDGGAGEARPWERSSVPADRQIRGLGPVLMSGPQLAASARVLVEVMGMRAARRYEDRGSEVNVFEMGAGGAGAELHLIEETGVDGARAGAGGVHHVAFRTTLADYDWWADRLASMGMRSSGPVDRFYFRSLYFREPGGVLFELATDEPGFAADEPLEKLGERLSLPPFLEGRRAEIEAGLRPLD